VITTCGHPGALSIGPTAELVVPFIIYAHASKPVDVEVLPQT